MTTTILALVVDPEFTGKLVRFNQGHAYTTIRANLNNGWLEEVHGTTWSAYVDEEGLLKDLPLNMAASLLAWRFGYLGDALVGPVVFVGPSNQRGDDTSVPPEFLEAANLLFNLTDPDEAQDTPSARSRAPRSPEDQPGDSSPGSQARTSLVGDGRVFRTDDGELRTAVEIQAMQEENGSL
jgi:hypothetical protein